MKPVKFNIRVYGILVNEKQEVLLTDELIKGIPITKFPGGGLEFGEGTIDCLLREFREETGQSVEVVSHFYTTDFFQISAYNHEHQIISIYYLVKPGSEFQIDTETKLEDLDPELAEAIAFRWIPLGEMAASHLSLPIDKEVAKLLQEKFGN